MKIGFFGSAHFVTGFLEALAASRHKLSFIVTSGDRPSGRGRIVRRPAAAEFAARNGIVCLQPEKVRDESFVESLRPQEADMYLVIAYGQKLPAGLLYLPPLHSFNLHFSLLPRWRGAAPVNWAVMSGDAGTGLTLMKMDEGLDTGDIVFQEKMPIGCNQTAADIMNEMLSRGPAFLVNALDSVERGDYTVTPQDDRIATYAAVLRKEDGCIDWTKPAQEVHNLARGLVPWPGAYTYLEGRRIIIWRTRLSTENGVSGRIESVQDGIRVGAGIGSVIIEEIQEEGRRRMDARSYVSGRRLEEGAHMESAGTA